MDLRLARNITGLRSRVNTLERQVRTLSAALAAVNAKTQRANTTIGPLSIGAQDVTITWPQEWPDAGYSVQIELITGTAAIGNVHAQLKAGTKTTIDCVVTVNALAVIATVGIDVVGVRT